MTDDATNDGEFHGIPEAKKPRRKSNNWKRPPHAGGYSRKNARSSARRIALHRKQGEALTLRERGLSFDEIAAELHRPRTAVFRWITEAIDRLTDVPAAAVLKLELRKLDKVQAAVYPKALQGDVQAVYAYLTLANQRARLLGLYPPPNQNIAFIAANNSERPPIAIEFVTPAKRDPFNDEPRDATPAPYEGAKPDYSRPALEPPKEAPFRWPGSKPRSTDWMK